MISPTVGRVVWYWAAAPQPKDQPRAAIVAYVHNDREVNLMVIDTDGVPYALHRVQLLQDDDPQPKTHFAMWMPYQIGQAKKYEELEKAKAG